jgi:hypothetical protein
MLKLTPNHINILIFCLQQFGGDAEHGSKYFYGCVWRPRQTNLKPRIKFLNPIKNLAT